MSNPPSAFFVFDTHAAAKAAIRTLSPSGFDMKKLSLVGKGYHSEGSAEDQDRARSVLALAKTAVAA
jgi:hypothetical protein